MALTALTQAERLELCLFDRRYLVQWVLPSKNLYISDRNYLYNYGLGTQRYENYLFDLSNLAVDLARVADNRNTKITLRFRNDPILNVDRLIELNATYRFCFSEVYIYELRLVTPGETFASPVATLVFRGVCGQPYDITRREFKVDAHNVLLAKRDRLPLQVVDTAVDANADPDDVGKIRNTIYGTVENVPCRCVVAGAKDTLAADIDDDDVTITVSGETKIAFPGSGTIQIDDEQITYTGFASNQFTGCTRGASAVGHNAGAAVFEVLSEYIYEVAKHPVKAIDAVYAGDVKQTAGFTAYTGQSGDELAGYAGRAVIKFTVLPVIKKQVQVEANDTIAVNDTTTVSDDINFSSANATREVFPNGQNNDGATNPDRIWDGADLPPCELGSSGNWVEPTFPSTSYGTIVTQYAYVIAGGSGDNTLNASSGWSPSSITAGLMSTFRFTKSGGSWNDSIRITAGAANRYVYEIWKEVEYTPTLTKSGGASRVAATKSGTVTVVGNSSADTVIGSVTADVDGYQDDGAGTYTGTASALIERPDHVLKHILIALLGEVAGNIGTSFAASGTSYGATYKFGFLLHEVAQQADRLLQALAFQCRSKFVEWNGKFELIYQGAAPAASKTFTDDELLDEPVFGYTPEVDIRNRIYAHYKRDYRKSGGHEAYDGVASDSDATSISNNGERVERVELSACRDATMAADWVGWYLDQVKQEWRTVEGEVPWIGKALDVGDTFSLTWDFFNAVTWDPVEIDVDRMRERVRIRGQEWPS